MATFTLVLDTRLKMKNGKYNLSIRVLNGKEQIYLQLSKMTKEQYNHIFVKKFDDKLYKQLFAIYLIVNGFWVLIIRANFNNRFAYLSWFMLAIIILCKFLCSIAHSCNWKSFLLALGTGREIRKGIDKAGWINS